MTQADIVFSAAMFALLSDDDMLARIAAWRHTAELAQKNVHALEEEALHRMANRGATAIPSERFVCEIITDVSYDRTQFSPLKEVFNELDLAKCWTPATQVMQVVPESWNTAKVKATAKQYGDAALAIVAGARVEARPRLRFHVRQERGIIR